MNETSDDPVAAGYLWTPPKDELRQLMSRLPGKASNKHIIEDYERVLANVFGATHALAFGSGTLSLLAAYIAVGVKSGDEVLVSPLAPSPSIIPLLVLGARPVFVDVHEPNSFALCLEGIDRAITCRTKALVDVPLWGAIYPICELHRHCRHNGIKLIQDLSQCHGSSVDGEPVGAQADIGCFSTQSRKIVATGEGGFAITNDSDLAEKLRSARDYGDRGRGYSETIGLNMRLGWPSALIGILACRHLEGRVAKRRSVASRLFEEIRQVGGVTPWPQREGAISSFYGFPASITVPGQSARVASALMDAGVETDVYRYSYSVIYERDLFRRFGAECRKAEELANRLVVLPCHDAINDGAITRIARSLGRAVGP